MAPNGKITEPVENIDGIASNIQSVPPVKPSVASVGHVAPTRAQENTALQRQMIPQATHRSIPAVEKPIQTRPIVQNTPPIVQTNIPPVSTQAKTIDKKADQKVVSLDQKRVEFLQKRAEVAKKQSVQLESDARVSQAIE